MKKLRTLTSLVALGVATTFAIGMVATPMPAVAAQKAAKKKAAKKAEPEAEKKPMTFDAGPQPLADMSARANQKREEVIKKLKATVSSLPKSHPQRPQRVFQLAEEYWKKSRYIYITGMSKLDKAMDTWAEAGSEGKPPTFKSLPEYRESSVYKS